MKTSYSTGSKKNIIGEKLFQIRKKYKLTQNELASKLQSRGYKISALTILRIEKGIRQVTDFELQAICHVTGVTPDELLEFGRFAKK